MPEPGTAPTPRNQFSFSRVKTFHQCPLRYRYRYLKGLKEVFRSIESYMGNVVHDVLEWLYDERRKRESPDLETALATLAGHWSAGLGDEIAVIRCSDRVDDYLVVAREILARFHRETFTRDRSTTVALEKRLNRKLSDSVVFTGFADRIGRTENGRLFVVDYKTSKKQGDDSEFSEGLQAPLYAACAMAHEGDTEALAGYHYLRHGHTRWQSVDEDRAAALMNRFRQLAEETSVATEFEPRPGILCAWCGFNEMCPSAEVPAALSGGLEKAREIADRSPKLYEHGPR
ncbi:MAG: PD-(D/E)XK nuclease family protein [Thermoanaerobaculales bacterium]|nr:PD-(D/E)XK nuclease family protein [Thermoanaerobaculales bacterium]